MSYLTGFNYDIFISYAHDDNAHAAGDFPADKLILQVEALTGTTMDDFGNITALDYKSWKSKRKQYLRVADQHARSCRYKEHNLYLRDVK